jgi:hypothetical protein
MEDVPDFTHDNNGKIYHDSRGRFAPNNPGRPPGIRNQARQAIKNFVTDQLENLPAWFESLATDGERLDALIRLLPYCVPRLNSVTDPEGERVDTATDINLDALTDDDLRILASLQKKLGLFP